MLREGLNLQFCLKGLFLGALHYHRVIQKPTLETSGRLSSIISPMAEYIHIIQNKNVTRGAVSK